MTKSLRKKVAVNTRTELIIRIPKALAELTSVKKDTEMEFSINEDGVMVIKQISKKIKKEASINE